MATCQSGSFSFCLPRERIYDAIMSRECKEPSVCLHYVLFYELASFYTDVEQTFLLPTVVD